MTLTYITTPNSLHAGRVSFRVFYGQVDTHDESISPLLSYIGLKNNKTKDLCSQGDDLLYNSNLTLTVITYNIRERQKMGAKNAAVNTTENHL